MTGMDVRIVAPRAVWNDASVIEEATRIATATGARITHSDAVADGVDCRDRSARTSGSS